MSRATSIPPARLTRPYELNFWVPQRIQHPKRPATIRLWSWQQSGAPSLIAFIGRIFPVCVTSTIALSPCRPRTRLLLRRMRSRRHRTVILHPAGGGIAGAGEEPRTGFASIPNQKRRPDCFGLHNVRARIGSPSTRQSRSARCLVRDCPRPAMRLERLGEELYGRGNLRLGDF
jgi:hypothetical protein